MNRCEFIAFVAQHAAQLKIPLHQHGALAGLPQEIERSLEIVDTLRDMRVSGPSADEVRRWYAVDNYGLTASHGRKTLECLQQLRDSDLDTLDSGELLLLATACANWSQVAMNELDARPSSRREVVAKTRTPELVSARQ